MRQLTIDTEFQSLIPPLSQEERQGLEENINQYGCRQPIDVWWPDSNIFTNKSCEGCQDLTPHYEFEGEWFCVECNDGGDFNPQPIIIDGHNRYDICQRLGLPFNTNILDFPDRNAVKIWIIRNQFDRRNLSAYNKSLLALKMESIFQEQGKMNQQEAGRLYGENHPKQELLANLPKALNPLPSLEDAQRMAEEDRRFQQRINTRAEVAKIAGVSERTIGNVKKIEAKASPEVKEKLARGDMSIHEAHKQIKREEQKQEREERLKQITETPKLIVDDRLPDLVLADPPWQYRHSATHARDIENHYETATIDDIKSHAPQTQENCLLLMWVTAPKVAEAVDVMQAWGFDYRTCAVWDKEIIGMGYWFRGQHELLFVGVKGDVKPPLTEDRQSSIFTERRGEHSKKPECVYQWIEQAFPESVKLEMYCRNPRPGWQVWGNEV